MNAILIGFIVYLIVVLAVGVVTARRSKTQADYLIGGRRISSWVLALSERASGESAWLLLGLPGAVLAVGMGEIWTVVGCLAGIVASWVLIARKLREETQTYGAMTLPGYLARKFGPPSPRLRPASAASAKEAGGGSPVIQVIASVIIAFFFTFYVAAQFNGAGKALNVTFGIDHTWGVLIGAGVILVYTVLGGFFAVAWTDMIQALIMIGTLVVLPVVGLVEYLGEGGAPGGLAGAGADRLSFVGGAVGGAAALCVVSGLSWGLGYTGQPHLLLRFIAMKDVRDMRKATTIALAWAFPAFLGAFFIGVVGLGLYGADAFADKEKLMPAMATGLLPAWLAGIFISGAIAAMMSTADSQILVVTSAVTEDIYHKVLKQEPGQSALVWMSRGVTLLMGVVAVILALCTKELVFSMVSYAWGGLGASFGPVILMSLYWKRLNRAGVIAGLVTGSISTVVWKEVELLQGVVPERLAGYVLAFAAVVVVTLLTSKPETVEPSREREPQRPAAG